MLDQSRNKKIIKSRFFTVYCKTAFLLVLENVLTLYLREGRWEVGWLELCQGHPVAGGQCGGGGGGRYAAYPVLDKTKQLDGWHTHPNQVLSL